MSFQILEVSGVPTWRSPLRLRLGKAPWSHRALFSLRWETTFRWMKLTFSCDLRQRARRDMSRRKKQKKKIENGKNSDEGFFLSVVAMERRSHSVFVFPSTLSMKILIVAIHRSGCACPLYSPAFSWRNSFKTLFGNLAFKLPLKLPPFLTSHSIKDSLQIGNCFGNLGFL